MFNRKKTIVFINLLIIMALLFNISCFAIAPYVTNQNIAEGIYHIQNSYNMKYMQHKNTGNPVQSSFGGNLVQKWELIYVSDGYYNIKNVSSNLYLTAPNSSSAGVEIEESALSTEKTDRQLWKFTILESGKFSQYDICKVQAKSQESSSMALATSDSANESNEYDVIQKIFAEYDIPDDEWVLIPVDVAYLVGIDYGEEGHDHTTALTTTNNNLTEEGYLSNLIITENTTTPTLQTYLKNSDIFAIRWHGGSDGDSTYMCLHEITIDKLDSWNIYNFNSNKGIDLSDCDIAVFVGCETANHPTQSLPCAAVAAGAKYAIGFETTIYCREAESWTELFFEYYLDGETVEDAAWLAALDSGDSETINSWILVEQ